MTTNIALWNPPAQLAVLDSESNPNVLVGKALQLRERERSQIAMNLEAGNFELASSFVWIRTMALLKKQLASLGNEFIGELLQRPDIDEYSDIATSVSDSEAISLARDLAILTPLQTMRLLHSQAIVSHFAAAENDPAVDQNEVMTQQEAISCLRVCIQGILGHDNVGAAEDFKQFRNKLESVTFTTQSPELHKLQTSPYFFIKTAISILLSIFKTGKGASLEHAARNALLIIPQFWNVLKAPERWQIGQAYAVEFSEGRTESVKALHAVLVSVAGFDFVPENLRSATFVRVASAVISAHEGMNNFYNEPAPMRELASLGTSIPGPALATCMTAVICVKIGNFYGVSRAAQSSADQVISGLSSDRWIYYLNERLGEDRLILTELRHENPARHWVTMISALGLDHSKLTNKDAMAVVFASIQQDFSKVQKIAAVMLHKSLGVQ
jgi:hypothetical protein